MKNKINKTNLKAELKNVSYDFDLTKKQRKLFVSQVYDYVIGTEVKQWESVYCYIDGLLTRFKV